MKKILLIVLLLSVGFSQQNWNIEFMREYDGLIYSPNSDKPYTGKVYSFNYSGQKLLEGTYKDGKEIESIKWEYYGYDGQKESVKTYKDGKQDGLEAYWWSNGQKSDERNYKDGKMDGLWTSWYDNGQKRSEETYKDDEEISSKCWDKDGNECECGYYGGCE